MGASVVILLPTSLLSVVMLYSSVGHGGACRSLVLYVLLSGEFHCRPSWKISASFEHLLPFVVAAAAGGRVDSHVGALKFGGSLESASLPLFFSLPQ